MPHNSPVHIPLDPVSQSYLLSGSPGFRKPTTLPKPKRNRAPTFPGADPPNLTFFEGSKKSDWSTYSSDTDLSPQWSEDQKSGSPKQDNRAREGNFQLNGDIHVSKANCVETIYSMLGDPYLSRDAMGFHAPAKQQKQNQPHQDIHQRENQYPHYSGGCPSLYLDRSRKPHSAKPTAIPNVTWVERAGNRPENINANGTFGHYSNPPSSVDSASLSPASTSVQAAKSSSPLIVTSICTPNRSGPSLCATDEPLQPRFTFNPKAEDFVLIPETNSTKNSEVDEYVGFYLNPEAKSSQPPKTPAVPSTYDCDPMAWQVSNALTSPNVQRLEPCGGDRPCSSQCKSCAVKKSPEEFIGDIPKNMNWEKTFLPVGKKKARTKSWASMDSDGLIDTITEAEVPTISNRHQKVSDVVSDCLDNPMTSQTCYISVGAPYSTGDNKYARNNTSEVDFSEPNEVAQTVADDTNFFDHDLHNIIKFPGYVGKNLPHGLKKAVKQYVEQEVVRGFDDSRGLDEEELFGSDFQHVKLPNCGQADIKYPDCAEVSVAGKIPQEPYAHKVWSKTKSKKVKSKVKVKAKPEPELEPETKPNRSDAGTEGEKTCQKPTAPVKNKTEPNTKGELEPQMPSPPHGNDTTPRGETTPAEKHQKSMLKLEETPHRKEKSSIPRTLDTLVKESRVFNYRDALLSQVTKNQKPTNPPPKIVRPKEFSKKVVVAPNITGQPTPARVEITPPQAQIGGRRKFFLSPLPTTATYDSVIRQLKGGMLEDIYISGLSPHPSAWKGPRGNFNSSQDFPHDNSWHAHVSFYSEEGASRFWELVQSSREYTSPYQSRYGGFDDQPPGFFFLDGMRVLVNWRHNDQRVVNSLTAKAVTEEKATRCLLLTFDVEAAMGSKNMTPFMTSIVETEKRKELAFVKKVAADIENWGQADSNLQGIRLFEDLPDNPPNSQEVAASNATAISNSTQSHPKEVKILVSFIKLLTAVKMKRYLSGRQGYGNNGFCIIEYHKDECDEPIDTLQATRTVDGQVSKRQFNDAKEITSVECRGPFTRAEPMSIEGKVIATKAEKWKLGRAAVARKAAEVDEEGFFVKGKGKIRGGNGKKSHPV